MLEFKGRVLIWGEGFGKAIVTRHDVMPTKAFSFSAENKSKKLICKDKANRDIYKKNLTGKVFVLPSFSSFGTNSMVLLSICKKKIAPKCFLFCEKLDESTVSAFILCKTFLDADFVVIDSLGKEFLQLVENGDEISFVDGLVVLKLWRYSWLWILVVIILFCYRF